MELMKAILERRSIRKFKDKKLSKEQIKEILESARWAPSWANTQVWEFVVIRDREQIHKVVGTFSETNPARLCADNVPAVIIACAKDKVSGYKKGEQRTRFAEWLMFDLGMAVQNLCLRAYEMGLGTVVVGSLNHQKIDKMLHIPENYVSVAAIPLGYPDQIGKDSSRKPVEEFVFSERFGDPLFTNE